VLFTAAMVFALTASLARAELAAEGDLFVQFQGGIDPGALPRKAPAPISVEIEGTIQTLSGERPPSMRSITIELNRGGRIDTHGLPVCYRRQVMPSTTHEAREICGDALVGEGSYNADIGFPEQEVFSYRGHVLAFNSIVGGKRAILAHVFSSSPAPLSRIIIFRITNGSGEFGTVLSGALPESLIPYGYLKRIRLNLHRQYTYKGRSHSYLSAACAAPAGFTTAVFPLARASMGFEDGRTLSSTLTRSCRVKGS